MDAEGKFWIFSPKYRDKFMELAGKMWKFNFMGKTQGEAVDGTAKLCDKFPLHGQFGEKSEDQKTIEILAQVERTEYDDSLCQVKTKKNKKSLISFIS